MAFAGQARDGTRPGAAAAAPETPGTRPSDATDPSAPSFDERIDALLYETRWAARAITYSDPDKGSDYGSGYWADDDGDFVSAQHDGFARFSPAQLAVVHATLNTRIYTQAPGHAGLSVEGFTNLEIAYAGPGAAARDPALCQQHRSEAARRHRRNRLCLLPGPLGLGRRRLVRRSRVRAGGRQLRLHGDVHETGHALGLKHGHETGAFGALPGAWTRSSTR